MKDALKRFDRGLARGEAAIAATVLIMLILVAATQAFLRNLTNLDLMWANEALDHFRWADSFMQKATLWLAFLGASLATHDDKHIAIDIFSHVASPKARAIMKGFVGIGVAIICFYLSRVFLLAVMNNAADIPLDYAIMDEEGQNMHICSAAASAIEQARMTRPSIFCGVRSFLDMIGVAVSTPDTALQLIVPPMFLIIGVRFFLKGIGSFMAFSTGGVALPHADLAAERKEALEAAADTSSKEEE